MGVSSTTIYKKARKLDINTKTITNEDKQKIIESCSNYIEIRNNNEKVIQYINEKVKALPKLELSSSNNNEALKIMYELLIENYNSNRRMIDECKAYIEYMGVMIKDYNGNYITNPIMKTYLSLIKSSSVLTRDILLLKDKVLESEYDELYNPFL